ncbi:hypothetical protein [Sphaerothrix gracilis]|uniref:hypothetical protein n=1 Tax=Sphaerothrix gracilis TaxID=3151835 RepID=UPI0031FCE83E
MATTTKTRAKTRVPKSGMVSTPARTSTAATHFQAADYLPSDLFTASSPVPSISEVEYTQRLEKIQGQIRAVKIVQQNLTLSNELQVAEGISVQGQLSAAKNAVLYEKLNTQTVKLQQAQTTTQIEQAKLEGLNITLQGEQATLPLQQQTWDLRLEGLQVDIEHARRMLAEKRELLPKQIEVLS